MNETATNSDGFYTARVASLQPTMSVKDLAEPAMPYGDPVARNDMLNILRLWSHDRRDIPDDFCDHVHITSVVRQPATFLYAELERVHRSLKAVDEPFDGANVNQQRWPTQDLFELSPFAALSFPNDRVAEQRRIPGQEDVRRM